MGNTFNWLQLLIALLLVGGPVLGTIIGKLKEQAALKRARDETKRRQQEALRTTQVIERTNEESETEEDRRSVAMRELAARRQAQLRELRRRQAQSQTGQQANTGGGVLRAPSSSPSGGGGGGGAGTSIPGGPFPTPTGRGQRQQQREAQRQQRRQQRGGQQRPARRESTPPVRDRQGPDADRPTADRIGDRIKESAIAVGSTPIRSGAIGTSAIGEQSTEDKSSARSNIHDGVRSMLFGADGHVDHDKLRKAVALTEVLGTPTSLREPHELPWHRG